jgi:hypothetical protein
VELVNSAALLELGLSASSPSTSRTRPHTCNSRARPAAPKQLHLAVHLPTLDGRLDIFLVTHDGSIRNDEGAAQRRATALRGPLHRANTFGHPIPETIDRLNERTP